MKIKSTLVNKSGKRFDVAYYDMESLSDLRDKQIHGVHAICFCGDKMVIVYSKSKGTWTPPGGAVEKGETAEEATIREVKEETNMKVLKHQFIGFQEISEPHRITTQTRSICIVEPYGDFVSDPDDGEITEIKLIDPKDYKEYFE